MGVLGQTFIAALNMSVVICMLQLGSISYLLIATHVLYKSEDLSVTGDRCTGYVLWECFGPFGRGWCCRHRLVNPGYFVQVPATRRRLFVAQKAHRAELSVICLSCETHYPKLLHCAYWVARLTIRNFYLCAFWVARLTIRNFYLCAFWVARLTIRNFYLVMSASRSELYPPTADASLKSSLEQARNRQTDQETPRLPVVDTSKMHEYGSSRCFSQIFLFTA